MSDNQFIKKILAKYDVYLDDKQISIFLEELGDYFLSNNLEDEDAKYIQEIKLELSRLNIENKNLNELLNQKYHDKRNQTIAYQVGILVLNFLKNPKQSFIKPNDVVKIYIEFLRRKEKKVGYLSKLEKLLFILFSDTDVKVGSYYDNELVPKNASELYLNKDIKKLPSNISRIHRDKPNNLVKVTTEYNFDSTQNIKQALNLDFSNKNIKDIKVAVILDEFSFNSFKYEFTPVVIEPQNWLDIFEKESPDIFFCESAWSGVDSIRRPWKGRVYSSINFNDENRKEVLEIIKYCNSRGIPTVFWNKEDPTHYPDKIHNFVETAKLFDFVFTTADECVNLYREQHNLNNVFALQFATQPKLFNPMQNANEQRSENVVFAGSWYANHIERSQAMENIFTNILNNGYKIEFFNRYYNSEDQNHKIPESFEVYEKPNVSNEKVADVYKSSIFGLNMNTVTNSKTMFSRRVFELMSSYTFIISNYSFGMDQMLGDNVIFLDKQPNALKEISRKKIDEVRESNLNEVLKNHTYENRFRQILDDIGASYNIEEPTITYIVNANTKSELLLQINFFRNKLGNSKSKSKLIILLSDSIPDIELSRLYTMYNFGDVSVISESYIKKYGTEGVNYISSSHFIMADSLENLDTSYVDKAILHSCYTEQTFISLYSNNKCKYKLVEGIELRNILSPKNRFIEVVNNYGSIILEPIYFI